MSARIRSIRHDDVNLFVEDRGEGPLALVFLHNWGSSGRAWSAVIDALAPLFRCINLDLRGWGRSDGDTEDYSLVAQARDTEWVIATLRLTDYALVGHFMGAKIAQLVAAQHPSGLHGMALVAPAPPTPMLVSSRKKQEMLDSCTSRESMEAALPFLTRRPLTDDGRRQVIEDAVRGKEGAKRAWIESGLALDIAAQVRGIQVPIKVIVGAADQTAPEREVRQAFEPLTSQIQFEMLEGVGHLSPLEAPRSVADAISDFFAPWAGSPTVNPG